MKSTYIVGASGAAKEIFLLLKTINNVEHVFDFKGFIDLNPKESTLSIGKNKFNIFNEVDFLKSQKESCNIIFGIAFPERSKLIMEKYKSYSNFSFPNLIHPQVNKDESVTIGIGNIICDAVVLTVDITIGNFNLINRGVHIGHDVTIGNHNVINPCTVVSGGVTINNLNLIGTHATILQYLDIDSSNIVGAGAVVTKSISNNNTVIGIPAKSINNG
ncbi:acetyltransferase [uncultured Winogradskyella sp.]|uniref:acetyltransferase n=1 Tax=uncultured Winogradskyella sp. TaxID=395353 RepID=UPI00261A29D6|nr:acetyltransferase [uncultured Winogradskyella sp.]